VAKPIYLFVYGTLRKGGGSPLHELLATQAHFEGEAKWPGVLYQISTYPGAVASRQPAQHVRGELYALADAVRAFELLDAHEECGATDPQPHLFVRQRHPVTTAAGHSVKAWLYVYNRRVDGLRKIDSGDWLK